MSAGSSAGQVAAGEVSRAARCPLMSASQHFLLPLISRWWDRSALSLCRGCCQELPPYSVFSPPPSVTPDLHHTHIRDVTLQRIRIARCLLRPLSREWSRAAQDLARGIRFRKWLPLPGPPTPHKKQYHKQAAYLSYNWCRGMLGGRKKIRRCML